MTSWRKQLLVAVLMPVAAAAADPAMLELIMPDARVVLEINLDRMVASPIGQAMSAQMKTELHGVRSDWQQPLVGFNLDWSHFAQEVIFAGSGAPGKQSPSLVIVRGLLDPAWLESLNAFHGAKSTYMGVPILSSSTGTSVVAFLNGSIAVIGEPADVKAAIGRRGKNTPPSPVLAEGLERFEGQYDAWMISAGALAPSKTPAGNSLKWLERVDAFTGAVRLSPDLELNADITMRTEKDVAEMVNALKWFAGVVQTQESAAASLDNVKFQVDGKRLSLSLQVPEKQVRAALQQRQTGQPGARAAVAKAPEISNGMPEPPSGTIRVQSSPADMGTVLLPVTKTP